MTDWRAVPKLELHLHLEGAAPPALARRLAAAQGISLDGFLDEAGGYAWEDFAGFLAVYERVAALFAAPESYRALTEAVLAEQAKEGVIYTEIFVSPPSLGFSGGAWAEMLAAIEEGADAAEAKYGIVCRLIPVVIRHHGPDAAAAGARAILAAPRGRMRGFGLAGDERNFAAADFTRPFRAMAEAGFRLTAHAGEFGGPESVRDALDTLHVERLGHGVRAVEDAGLTRRLAAEKICLELCPGSNVALGLYPALAAHPIEALRRAGCAVTVSTDDPPFFGSTIGVEYLGLAAAFGYGGRDFAAFNRAALDAAFCEPAVKTALAARLARSEHEAQA